MTVALLALGSTARADDAEPLPDVIAHQKAIDALAITARELVGLQNCAGAFAVAEHARAIDADVFARRFPIDVVLSCRTALVPRLAPEVPEQAQAGFPPLRFDVEVSTWLGPDDAPGHDTALILRNSFGLRYATSQGGAALRLSGFLELGTPFGAAAGGEIELDPAVGEHTELGVAFSAAADAHDIRNVEVGGVFALGVRARIADQFFFAVDGMHDTGNVNAVVFGGGVRGRAAYPVLAVEGGIVMLGATVVLALMSGGGWGHA